MDKDYTDMRTPDTILRLCDTFIEHKVHYKSRGYNETQLRREFLDPFWKALGWDIDNERGIADAYKDVIHEDSIKVGQSTKAPDYCFRIGGLRKFFLEAKKPAIDIRGNIGPAYQLRRYAWSAKLRISIVSDFEEFALYDTTIRPANTDKASVARMRYFGYEDYGNNWEEIDALFSRRSVIGGSLDALGEQTKRRNIGYEVDDAFLDEIEQWRQDLARDIASNNPQLAVRDLNFAVQKIIDRIIFLRICEDRGIEDYGRLRSEAAADSAYKRTVRLFREAEARFNSGLFHFQAERGRPGIPDMLTPNLRLDDDIIPKMIGSLYYPESPYEFSVLPADILGQVYERFLGKTIGIGARQEVLIEDKPEVRKAGGVYYTPTYIVDYIVNETLGRLLNRSIQNTSRPISLKSAAKIKVVDPACGSGSFLISAYQHLLNWHRDRYAARGDYYSKGKNPKLYEAPGGGWELTTAEKKRILLNNIHGVDVDPQAVEVTKLSLLLKVLEGATRENLQRDFFSQRERILPDLGENIRCGNSLIAPDYYDNQQLSLLHEDEIYRRNAFCWDEGFGSIMDLGGFDCVIGNPPWGADLSDGELRYLRSKHSEIVVRMIDSFMYFVSASVQIMREGGYLGMILPDVFLYQKDNEKLRRLLFQKHTMINAINAGNVFEKVTRPTSIVIAKKAQSKKESIRVADISFDSRSRKPLLFSRGLRYEFVDSTLCLGLPNARIPTGDVASYSIVSKILSSGFPTLDTLVDDDGIQRGVSPDLKEAFVVTPEKAKALNLEECFLKLAYTGGTHVKRYCCAETPLYLIYTTRKSEFSRCPNICKYIDSLSEKITCKEVAQGKHPIYALHRPRKSSIFEKDEKFLGVITEDEIVLSVDKNRTYATDGLYLFSLAVCRI